MPVFAKRISSTVHSMLYLGMWFMAHRLFRKTFEPSIIAFKPHVVHCHDGLALPLAAHSAQRLGATSIYDSHELEAHRNHPLIKWMRPRIIALERRYLPQIDHVVTVGDKIADHLAASYDIARPLVLFNAPPLQPDPLPPRWDGAKRATLRRETGLSDEAVLMVYTGNIASGRGLEQTFTALEQYLKKTPAPADIHLAMVGQINAAYRAQLERQIINAGLSERIHFLPSVAPSDVTRFISDADIALLPILPNALSHQYAMPNKLFEALHAGLPILGAKLEEMQAFMDRNNLGVTYDPEVADSFIEGLQTLLARPKPNAERLSEIAAQNSWEAQGDKLLQLYAPLGAARQSTRVAMVVPNPCDPDFRIVKEAQTLAKAGYEVRVFCTRPDGSSLPEHEVINGVEYVRLNWSAKAMFTPRWLSR